MSRHVDEELLSWYRQAVCDFCETLGVRSEPHHAVMSKGAGGPDIHENLISVCRTCHARIHSGAIPKKAVLALIACREGKTIDEVQQIVWEFMRNGSKAQSNR